jgi:hypothetical protein
MDNITTATLHLRGKMGSETTELLLPTIYVGPRNNGDNLLVSNTFGEEEPKLQATKADKQNHARLVTSDAQTGLYKWSNTMPGVRMPR